jgi:hypothetical protein
LANYDGPTSTTLRCFGSPVIKQLLKRDSPLFARNALYVTFFARMAFDDKLIDPLEDALLSKISSLSSKFNDKTAQAKILIADAGLLESDMCVNNLPVDFEIKITSPLMLQFVNLIQKGDELINHYDTLWMNGIVKSGQFNEMRYEVKKDLRGVIAFVRNTWVQLQKRMQADKATKIAGLTGEAVSSQETPEPKPSKTAKVAVIHPEIESVQTSLLETEAETLTAAG